MRVSRLIGSEWLILIQRHPLAPSQQGSFSSAGGLSLQAPSASSHSPFPGSQSQQPVGGMKLEAVMENLQRQQAARLALEEKLRQAEQEKDLRSMVESQIHQQTLAFRHYQAAMRGALAAGVASASPAVTLPLVEVRRAAEEGNSSRPDSDDKEREEEGDETEEQEQDLVDEEEAEDDEDDVGLNHHKHRHSAVQGGRLSPKSAHMHLMTRVPATFVPARRSESPSTHQQSQHHEWTYEEQFKQVRTPGTQSSGSGSFRKFRSENWLNFEAVVFSLCSLHLQRFHLGEKWKTVSVSVEVFPTLPLKLLFNLFTTWEQYLLFTLIIRSYVVH